MIDNEYSAAYICVQYQVVACEAQKVVVSDSRHLGAGQGYELLVEYYRPLVAAFVLHQEATHTVVVEGSRPGTVPCTAQHCTMCTPNVRMPRCSWSPSIWDTAVQHVYRTATMQHHIQ